MTLLPIKRIGMDVLTPENVLIARGLMLQMSNLHMCHSQILSGLLLLDSMDPNCMQKG